MWMSFNLKFCLLFKTQSWAWSFGVIQLFLMVGMFDLDAGVWGAMVKHFPAAPLRAGLFAKRRLLYTGCDSLVPDYVPELPLK